MNLFGKENRVQVINALISATDDALKEAGFSQTGRGEWSRKVEWRIDQVDLRLREAEVRGLLPAFRVMLPRGGPSPVGDRFEYIAEVKLPRILAPGAEPDAYVKVPAAKSQVSGFIDRIVQDILRALVWFDQFATPELCRANLAKFLKPGCPAYEDAVRFLTSLRN